MPLLLFVGWALPAPAQVRQGVTGFVLEEGTDRPVQGAFVALLDLEGRRVGGTLSHDDGRFILSVPAPGRYRLQPERIGFGSVPSEEVEVPPGGVVRMDLAAPAQAILIAGIEVGGDKRCDLSDAAGRATMALWEEARKALAVARWTETAERFAYDLRSWDRTYDARGREIVDERIDRSTYVGRHAFRAIAPEALVADGYVVGDPTEGYDYYAPDAEILLSDPFLRTHCFQAVRRGDRLGLRFEPVPDRELSDVEGTLWMAPNSTRLERLEFRYVNVADLDRAGAVDRAGGEVVFEELPGGEWIVRWWEIRMPVLFRNVESAFGRGHTLRVSQVKAQGGEVEGVRDATPTRPVPGGGAGGSTIVGIVADSTSGQVLPGARVYLTGTQRVVEADAEGRFSIPGVEPGVHTLVVGHARLAQLGVPAPTVLVDVGSAEEVRADLAVPSVPTLVEETCAAVGSPPRNPGEAGVAGIVRSDGVATEDLSVEVRWQEEPTGSDAPPPGTSATVALDPLGRWGFCALPGGHHVEVTVVHRDGPAGDPVALGVMGPDETRWVVVAAPAAPTGSAPPGRPGPRR